MKRIATLIALTLCLTTAALAEIETPVDSATRVGLDEAHGSVSDYNTIIETPVDNATEVESGEAHDSADDFGTIILGWMFNLLP